MPSKKLENSMLSEDQDFLEENMSVPSYVFNPSEVFIEKPHGSYLFDTETSARISYQRVYETCQKVSVLVNAARKKLKKTEKETLTVGLALPNSIWLIPLLHGSLMGGAAVSLIYDTASVIDLWKQFGHYGSKHNADNCVYTNETGCGADIIIASVSCLPKIVELNLFDTLHEIWIVDCDNKSVNDQVKTEKEIDFDFKDIPEHIYQKIRCIDIHKEESGDSLHYSAQTQYAKSDLAMFEYSSGTTGERKGAVLTHHALISESRRMFEASIPPFTADDVILCAIPLPCRYGTTTFSITALKAGASIVVLRDYADSLENVLSAIQNHKITTIVAMPKLVVQFSKSPLLEKYDLSSLRQIIFGAGPVSKNTIQKCRDRLISLGVKNIKMRQTYGSTETGKLTMDSGNHIGSVGKLFPSIESRIVDIDSGAVLSFGKTGELCVKSPSGTKGYLHTPQITDEEAKDGWIRTGDCAYFDEKGYLYIVDRLKQFIKYDGKQVSLSILEGILSEHDFVKDSIVVGIPHPVLGEVPKAYIVPSENIDLKESFVKEDIMRYVAKRVSPQSYKELSQVAFVDKIPKNIRGKTIRMSYLEMEKLIQNPM